MVSLLAQSQLIHRELIIAKPKKTLQTKSPEIAKKFFASK